MTTTRRVLITGSRTWTNNFLIHNVLTSFHWMLAGDDITLVSGACPTGADFVCEHTARELGWKVERHPAQWDQPFGVNKRAGFERNAGMVELGADICLAFIMDDSKGATHCSDLAERRGIHTLRYKRYTNGVELPPAFPDEKGNVEQGDPDILRGVEAVNARTGSPEGAGDHW